jgi:hypothetical protein
MLPADAIHPMLMDNYNRLVDIVAAKKGLLGGYSVLHVYLREQLEVLKYCDIMFGHDFGTDPRLLMNYAIDEIREVVPEIPLLDSAAEGKHVDGPASLEGGDVVWFLAMREALAQLNPEKNSLSADEERMIVGTLTIFDGLAKIYPDFNPEKHAREVADKNRHNYPHRVLRASPAASIAEMSNDFAEIRLPLLKDFRKQLPERKIPIHVHGAIQRAEPVMPEVEFAHPDAYVKYSEVVIYARKASQFYAYDRV